MALIPVDVFHGGHYGDPDFYRFHFTLSQTPWLGKDEPDKLLHLETLCRILSTPQDAKKWEASYNQKVATPQMSMNEVEN